MYRSYIKLNHLLLRVALVCFIGLLAVPVYSNDSLKLRLLENEAKRYKVKDIKKYRKAINELLKESIKTNNDVYTCISYRELGFAYYIESKNDSATIALQKSLDIAEKIDDKYLVVRTTMYQGLVSLRELDYYSALEYFKKHSTIAQQLKDKDYPDQEKEAHTDLEGYHMMAVVYQKCGDFDKARHYFIKSTPSTEPEDLVEGNAWWKQDYGALLFEEGDYLGALSSFQSAASIWERLNMDRGMGITKNSIGRTYLELKDKKALEAFSEALAHNKKLNNYEEIIDSYMGLAKYYLEIEDNVDEAIKSFSSAIQYSLDSNLEEAVIPAMRFFIENPQYIEESPLSYEELLSINLKATESTYEKSQQANKKLVEAIEKIDTAEKEQELSALETKFLRRINLLFLAVLLTISSFIFLIYRKNKKIKASSDKIRDQFTLIKEQSKVLSKVNAELRQNNISLTDDFNLQSLKLTHFKEIFKDLEDLQKNEVSPELKSVLKTKLKDDFWNELDYLHEFRDKKFIEKLTNQHPDLTTNNITLCCMLRMGLSNFEIGQITYRTPASIKVAKTRLWQKLNLKGYTELIPHLNSMIDDETN